MVRLPPSSTRTVTRFPYTTVFRSIVFRLAAEDFEAPGGDGAAGRLGVAVVAGEDILQALLVQHVDGFGEAVEQVGTGCVDRKSTRLNPVTNAQLVFRLLLETTKKYVYQHQDNDYTSN